MKQIQVRRADQVKPKPPTPIDTRTPSGKRLPF